MINAVKVTNLFTFKDSDIQYIRIFVFKCAGQ